MEIDMDRLESAMAELKAILKGALLVATIWDRRTGLSLVDYNSSPAAVALLTDIYDRTNDQLLLAGLTPVNEWFLMELQGDKAGLMIRHGDTLLQGMLVDTAKANIGVLVSVVLPRMLKGVNMPRTDVETWKRALTGAEPKVSALATRLLLGRLRDEVKRNPARLDAAVAQLRDFFAANAFAMRDLANL